MNFDGCASCAHEAHPISNGMKLILGTKLGMSQIFTKEGSATPVTLVMCMPSHVTQVKSQGHDGYVAVQAGYGSKKHMSKPLVGHTKDMESFRWMREFRMSQEQADEYKRGDAIDVSRFEEGEIVRVSAVSKGKGFQGVVKRWGFHGAPKTHGTKNTLRAPGSIGSSFPQHVLKGKKMAGRMGSEQKTRRMHIVKVDVKNNILLLDGPVPGPSGGLVKIGSV